VRIGTVEVGLGHRCAIVAELSNAANGASEKMVRLMRAATDAGADILKAQAYTPSELVTLRGDGPAPEPWQRYTMRELYTKAQTPLAWLPAMFEFASVLDVPLFASVFGSESLTALEAVGCPAYKISHFECANDDLAQLVMATKKPVIVSQGYPLAKVSTYYWRGDVLRLLCPGGYPAQPEELRLGVPFHWSPWGFSCHCRDPLAAVVAVARGAAMVELHFHLENEPSELESNISYNEKEFSAVVQLVRQTEAML
jgi:pseudaminic acid synthase